MTQKEENPVADRTDHKFTLRLTEWLHDAIFESSARQGRSVNTEILLRLARTVEEDQALQASEARLHAGVIEFLAMGVEELAALLPEEQRKSERVKVLLELTGRLTPPKA